MQSKMLCCCQGKCPDIRSPISSCCHPANAREEWTVYCQTAGESEMYFAAYTTSCCGGVLRPSVLIMRPMTDLCWPCQQNSVAIVCYSNCSEDEKLSTNKKAEEHLRLVQMERSYYTSS